MYSRNFISEVSDKNVCHKQTFLFQSIRTYRLVNISILWPAVFDIRANIYTARARQFYFQSVNKGFEFNIRNTFSLFIKVSNVLVLQFSAKKLEIFFLMAGKIVRKYSFKNICIMLLCRWLFVHSIYSTITILLWSYFRSNNIKNFNIRWKHTFLS